MRLLLMDDVVGHGLNEEARPIGGLIAAGRMQRKQRFRLGPRHDAVAKHFTAQKLHIVGRDAALPGQPGNRRRKCEFAHDVPPSAADLAPHHFGNG